MISNIQESLQQLIAAGADSQKNLFYVEIKPSTTNGAVSQKFWEGVSVRVGGFKTPEIAKKTANLEYQDMTIPKVVAGETFKKTFTLNLRSDINHEAYGYFTQLLTDTGTNVGGSDYPSTPKFFTIHIYTFNTDGSVKATPIRSFRSCELTGIGGLDFSYSSTGPQDFSLTFIYESMTI